MAAVAVPKAELVVTYTAVAAVKMDNVGDYHLIAVPGGK